MALILALCLILLAYIYLGYPSLVFLLARFSGRSVYKDNYIPPVTILIAAYNEALHIRATIEDKLALDYPREKLEIIVISDASEDGTDNVVREYAPHGVRLIRQEPRKGKTSALNLAVLQATGEILVFSDANSLYASDALLKLMRNFADPQVGYVTGKMIYVNSDGMTIGDGCSTYMKYENMLRALETRAGSVVGVDGGIDAVRKKLYQPMRDDQLPDFVLPLSVVEQGFRVVYEHEAFLKEDALKSAGDEYRMRVRVSLRALWALWDMKSLLHPGRHGRFALQLFSHKVLRYLGILFMAGAYVSNILLLKTSRRMRQLFILQNIFYGISWMAYQLDKKGCPLGILYIPYYFTLINIAAGHALIRFLRGDKQVLWTPRKG